MGKLLKKSWILIILGGLLLVAITCTITNSGSLTKEMKQGDIKSAITDFNNRYSTLEKEYRETQSAYGQLREYVISFKDLSEEVVNMENELENNNPELANDKVFFTIKTISLNLDSKLNNILNGIRSVDNEDTK